MTHPSPIPPPAAARREPLDVKWPDADTGPPHDSQLPAVGAESSHELVDEARPMLRPSINVRVEYRQLGTGPDSVEVQWDHGTVTPSADDICRVISELLRDGSRP